MAWLSSTCFLALIAILLGEPEHYWREYSGIVPDDAIIGTTDGKYHSYIGSAQANGHGLYNGQLFGGLKEISVFAAETPGGLYTKEKNIKILCGAIAFNFQWLLFNDTTFSSVRSDKLVIGGYTTYGNDEIYIGKSSTINALGNVYRTPDNRGIIYYAYNESYWSYEKEFYLLIYNAPTMINNLEIEPIS